MTDRDTWNEAQRARLRNMAEGKTQTVVNQAGEPWTVTRIHKLRWIATADLQRQVIGGAADVVEYMESEPTP